MKSERGGGRLQLRHCVKIEWHWQKRRQFRSRPSRIRQRLIIVSLSSVGLTESAFEFVDEVLQLISIEVADREEFKTPCTPALDVKSLDRLEFSVVICRSQSLCNKEIDHMRSPSIDDRSDVFAVDIVEPPTDEREALGRQVDNRWGNGELTAKPWFHRVLIARLHIGRVLDLKRAPMRRNDVRNQPVVPIRLNNANDEARSHRS